MMAGSSFTATHSGGVLDLRAPDWRAVDLEDIALSLARLPRFLGHTTRIVSVLEHSLASRLAALLHDGRESYLGDITRPVQRALAAETGGTSGVALDILACRIDRAIALRVLTLSPRFAGAGAGSAAHTREADHLVREMARGPVRLADDLACKLELKLFMRGAGRGFPAGGCDFYNEGRPDPERLQRVWLAAVEECVDRAWGSRREYFRLTPWGLP